MTWLARCPRPLFRGALQAGALHNRLIATRLERLRAMIPQLQQRAVHARAGPVAEEEGASLGRLGPVAPQQQAAALHQAAAAGSQHHAPHTHGCLEVIFGPMFAGKTTELLRRVEQHQRRGLSVAVVKSNKDDRYDLSHIVTHDGLKKPCYSVPTLAAFKSVAGADYHTFQVIAIDEAQFFGDLVEFCAAAADDDAKHVIVAGLDGDFQRRRFGQILDVVPFADTVTKLTAQCTYCEMEAAAAAAGAGSGRGPLQPANHRHGPAGTAAAKAGAPQQHQHHHSGAGAPAPRPALFSLRIAADNRQEVVGGADKYAPVCRHHYVRLSKVRSSGAESSSEEDESAAAGQ